MLIEIYLFLLTMGFVMAGVSFFTKLAQKEMVILPFLAAGLFFFAAIGSFAIQQPFCEMSHNDTSVWSCQTLVTTDPAMGYFSGGMGLIMLIAAIYWVVSSAGEYAVTGQTPQ